MNAITHLDDIRSRKDRIEASNRRAVASAAKLMEASEAQIKAAQDYQASITRLQDSIKRLETGWRDYDSALGTINVQPLQNNAKRLASMMEDWENRAASSR